MTHVIILDTYDYAKALKKANVPESQIDVEVARDKERTKAINEAINNNLSTKYDICLLQKEISNVGSSLKKDIDILEEKLLNKLTKILGGIIIGCATILGLLITFHH